VNDRRMGGSLSSWDIEFLFLRSVRADSGAHPLSYPVGAEDCGSEAARAMNLTTHRIAPSAVKRGGGGSRYKLQGPGDPEEAPGPHCYICF
jgi:hypothetical protein